MDTDNFPIPGLFRFSPGLERPGLETSPISFKNSFWKSTIFDAGSTRTGRASKIIGSQLKSFWKPLVWSGGPGRESPGIEMLEKSFRNLTEILKDFYRISGDQSGLDRERPGMGKLSVSKGFLLFFIKGDWKFDENRRMYRVFAVKTRKNAIRSPNFLQIWWMYRVF